MHCLETIGPGGVEQRRLSMAKYLDQERYEQVLVCSQVIGQMDRRFQGLGTRIEVLGVMQTPLNINYFRRLLHVIKRERPDIIHGAVFEGVISAVVGGIIGRVPVIVIEETSEPANRSWRGNLFFRLLARFAHCVVATSPAVYDYVIRQGVSPKKARLIVNGVEPVVAPPEQTLKQLRSELGLRDSDFVVGSVGRMVDSHKLFSVLIESFSEFAKGREDAKLLLVGDGVDRDMLEGLCRTLRISDKVVFAGHRDDVSGLYCLMKIFALVPAREGFGLAAVEAMFMKLAVIASRVGGLAQVVSDGETGLLVNPGHVEGLTAALIELYDMPQERIRYGEAGKERANQFFHARRYVTEIDNLYKELLNE